MAAVRYTTDGDGVVVTVGCNRACAIDYAAFWGFFFPEPP